MSSKEAAKKFISVGGGFPAAQVLSAIVLVIASAVECSDNVGDGCNNEERFALIAGIILLILNVLYMIFYWSISDGLNTIACIFFFLFWGVAAGFITFEGPFVEPGNGYFAAWLGFLSASAQLAFNVREFDSMKNRVLDQGVPLVMLVVGSFVVIIASVSNGCCNNEEIIGIIAGVVSLVLTVVRIIVQVVDPYLFAVFMVGWWFVMGLILTFGLFEIVGNGYFGVIVCLVSSIYLASPDTITNAANKARGTAGDN
eukprot:augustus_masked-scaffold_8-processed-gene-6.50-mRNA-1 protein AED:0.17 eAED:0.19 QI:0/-1/0/1/-1/1/1/0/255